MNRTFIAACLLGLTPLWTMAQESKPPSKPRARPSTQATASWPEAKSKKLYAKNDLRGKQAPAFHVESWLSKQPQREGKVVLIDFWATWCPPCRELIPELEAIKAKFKDDLVVIGVSDEKRETVQKFIDDKKISYAMAIDTQAKMKKAVGIEGIPHVLIIDRDGIVRWQGFPQSDEERLTDELIQKIIDADKAAHPKTEQPRADKPDQAPKGK